MEFRRRRIVVMVLVAMVPGEWLFHIVYLPVGVFAVLVIPGFFSFFLFLWQVCVCVRVRVRARAHTTQSNTFHRQDFAKSFNSIFALSPVE